MCGFIAIFGEKKDSRFNPNLLRHRGPDHSGLWSEDSQGLSVAIAHSRLSVIDTSAAGNQPFFSEDGRYVLVFNGEIYNFVELRAELIARGVVFSSASDTEVFLKGLLLDGLDFQLKCNGMWAFLLWDRQNQVLNFGRDRFGKKPLFYRELPSGGVVFASEMKALYPYLEKVTPHKRIKHFFRNPFDYEHTSECAISGLKRVQMGHDGSWKNGSFNFRRWWNTLEHLIDIPGEYEEQVAMFRELFLDAVRIRMRSDVPIGTALSGGLDSSAVFCAMHYLQEKKLVECKSPPAAFTAHYPFSDIDETSWARIVTNHLSIPLHPVTIEPANSVWGLQDSIRQVEDPYITLPLPMLCTYRAIKESGITVTLDGHGADELFSGYGDLYLDLMRSDVRRAKEIVAVTNSLSTGEYFNTTSSLGVYKKKSFAVLKYLAKKARGFLWRDYARSHQDLKHARYKKMSFFNRRLYEIFHISILPTLLRNYDRYSMASGVEVRMPFMDHRLVTFCFSLPAESKLGGGYTKRILRDAMRGIVPDVILNRRDKIGWNAPLHEWLCGPMSKEIDRFVMESNTISKKLKSQWMRFKGGEKHNFIAGQIIWSKLQPAIWLASCDSLNKSRQS
jgi:asparagine synthase (glutamine-hydrolysing)